MPRATNIRGTPVAVAVAQRQAVFAARVQMASDAAVVEAKVVEEVAAMATDPGSALGGVLAGIETTLNNYNDRLNDLEHPP